MSGGSGRERRIGIISDTHGLVRPQALAALAGSELLVHAGDIGSLQVLEALASIAPVVAVRGNNDRAAWARAIPESRVVEVPGARLFVLHDLKQLRIDPAAEGFDVVISGHSHRPVVERCRGVLFVNPGSAGPRRFKLPIAVARLVVRSGAADAEIVLLEC